MLTQNNDSRNGYVHRPLALLPEDSPQDAAPEPQDTAPQQLVFDFSYRRTSR